MSAATVKPDPKLPPETICVECGATKREHKMVNERLRCFPLVLVDWARGTLKPVGSMKGNLWREFR